MIGRPVIPYDPTLRPLCRGSVIAVIIFQQLEYWFQKSGKTFYKFLEPCPNNPAYKSGDSWCEELGISAEEFRTAFDKVGRRYASKKEFTEEAMRHNTFMFVSYFDRHTGLTHYFRNGELISNNLETTVCRKPCVKTYSKDESPFPANRDCQDVETGIQDTQKPASPVCIIAGDYSETTSKTLSNKPEHPFDRKTHGIPQPIMNQIERISKLSGRKIHIQSLMLPIDQAISMLGQESVAEALRGVGDSYENPRQDREKIPRQLIPLLRSPDRMLDWASRCKSSETQNVTDYLSDAEGMSRLVEIKRRIGQKLTLQEIEACKQHQITYA